MTIPHVLAYLLICWLCLTVAARKGWFEDKPLSDIPPAPTVVLLWPLFVLAWLTSWIAELGPRYIEWIRAPHRPSREDDT